MVDLDEVAAELEHQRFMSELNMLVEAIFWAARDLDFSTAVAEYFDIKKYGNEPVFAGIIFDRIEREANEPR